jgi:Flp pilus assembly protein TadD
VDKMMEINGSLLRKLSQVGYMACMKGYIKEGEIIMDAVKGARPSLSATLIGVAIARITARRYQEAVDILKGEVLSQDPDNMTAKCFLAMALFELGEKAQSEEYFSEVAEKGSDSHKEIAERYTTIT